MIENQDILDSKQIDQIFGKYPGWAEENKDNLTATTLEQQIAGLKAHQMTQEYDEPKPFGMNEKIVWYRETVVTTMNNITVTLSERSSPAVVAKQNEQGQEIDETVLIYTFDISIATHDKDNVLSEEQTSKLSIDRGRDPSNYYLRGLRGHREELPQVAAEWFKATVEKCKASYDPAKYPNKQAYWATMFAESLNDLKIRRAELKKS